MARDRTAVTAVVRLANVIAVCVDGVELVAVQDEGFACAVRALPVL